jgi:outer membrane protein
MAVNPDWSLVRFIGTMSPQTRYKIAWLTPVAALVVLGTAWWGSLAPSESLQSLRSNTPLNIEPAEFQTNATKRSTSAFSTGGTDQEISAPERLDWSSPVPALRRLTPKMASSPAADLAIEKSRPAIRAKKISNPQKSQALAHKPSVLLQAPQKASMSDAKAAQSAPLRRLQVTPEEILERSEVDSSERAPANGRNPLDCWWQSEVPVALRPSDKKWEVQLDDLLLLALEHSDLVQSLRVEPLIRQTDIALEAAAFDPAAFVDSKWNDTSDPVGNVLATGGPNRLNEDLLENKAGLRQKNRLGGRLEAAQEVNLRDSNSIYFRPANQANTRLVLSYTQPLLRGRGRCYNEAFVVLAQINTDIARRQLQQQLQDHLLDVSDAYWTLYLERARFVQQQRALERTVDIQEELEARAEMDVVRSQILRARGAVAQRRAAVKRAEVGVRNQEAVVWSLTNAPELAQRKHVEILPQSGPDCRPLPLTSSGSVTEAINQRPEIAVVFEKIHAAQTRMGIAENELLPTLNLFMETYVRGLDGDYDVGRSLSKQFDTGAPSYAIGLSFLMPYGNHAAKATYTRRQLEMGQLAHELNATLKRVTVEVENSLRDIDAARVSIDGNRESLEAAASELDYLLDRWRMLPGDDRLSSLLLDEALGALDRLVASESAFAQSEVDYALSITRYKRAAGMLIQTHPISPEHSASTDVEPESLPPPAAKSASRPTGAKR